MYLTWIAFKYIIIFFPTLMFYLEKHKSTKSHIFEKIGILFLILVSFLRYGTGRDYFSYEEIYQYIANGREFFIQKEPLAYLLFKISGELSLPYSILIGFISTFFITTVYIVILKKVPLKYRYVGVFFFLIINANYFTSVATIRQSLAVGFFVIAMHFYNKSNIKLLFFMGVGALFHMSLWLVIPIIYLIKKISYKGFYYLLVPYVFLFIFPNILPILIDNVLNLIGIHDIYRSYLYIETQSLNLRSILKNISYIIIAVQFFIFVNLLRKNEANYYIKLLLIGLLLHLYISVGFSVLTRLLPYFYIFYPIVIVELLKTYKMKNGTIMFIFFILFAINNVKQIALPIEYSKYFGQYQLIIFKTSQDIEQDRSIYQSEERMIKLNRLK